MSILLLYVSLPDTSIAPGDFFAPTRDVYMLAESQSEYIEELFVPNKDGIIT